MRRSVSTIILGLLACSATVAAARADSAADRAAIIERLHRWTAAFNARDAAGACDLFTPGLVAIVPGMADGSRDAVCERIARVLNDRDLSVHYDEPDIREIIVSGDLAVVRLFWTLRTRKDGVEDSTIEAGMDIFERQPDGVWSIARYMSFPDRPNRNLP